MTATDATQVAIVGLGKIAVDQHVPSIARSPAFRLAATVSRNARAEGVDAFADLTGMLAARPGITAVALGVTALAGVVVLVTRFTQGAWVALLTIVVGALVMGRIHRHYAAVGRELTPDAHDDARALPSRVHVVVVVSTLNRPALRAIAYARATRPASLEAVVVDVDRAVTERVIDDWDRARMPLPLTVVASPYRDTVVPLVRHLRERRRLSPRDLTMVFIPEYVVRPGWRTLLHNRTATRQKNRLQREAGVMVGSVPWQIREGEEPGPRSAANLRE